ncbi:aminoglycoside adenylyltransferase domain-containing protein, partial [Streptomyces sp. NPDC048420]
MRACVDSLSAPSSVSSKDAAADRAIERLPSEHRGALAHARAGYLGDE